jgi:hypothetical protein
MITTFFECGCCGQFHKPHTGPALALANWLHAMDCRNDENRFTWDHPDVIAASEAGQVEYIEEDETA